MDTTILAPQHIALIGGTILPFLVQLVKKIMPKLDPFLVTVTLAGVFGIGVMAFYSLGEMEYLLQILAFITNSVGLSTAIYMKAHEKGLMKSRTELSLE